MREQIASGSTVSIRNRAAMMEALEPRELLSTFYVGASGNDSKSGTSSANAWKTINRLNQQKLKAGDSVLFQAGKTFTGTIIVASNEGGTSNTQVVFSSYGSGRATISSGIGAGIDIADVGGIAVTNLNFVGSGMTKNKAPGIFLHVEASNRKLSNVLIRNVEVKNYGQEGIRFDVNGPGGSSVSNVKIESSSLHDNLWGGLKATTDKNNVNKNWVVQRVQAYNNPGTRAVSWVTGSGIYISDVDGAVIQYCSAWNNGANGSAPVGIWSAGSNRVTMQYNESYNNRTATDTDGGGFDLDWDMNNSIMQYNYSHGNAGPGYMLGAGPTAGNGNVIRYNISENDGRKNGKSAIQVWGNVTNAKIYNNTIYISSSGNGNTAAFNAHNLGSNGKVPRGIEIRNNIFQTVGQKILNIASGVMGGTFSFIGNAYYSGSSSLRIQWGSTLYTSLTSWRNAKGQEKLNGAATGYQGDPKLNAPGRGGTVGAEGLHNLSAYKLQSSSPLINRGVVQPSVLSSVVKYDFFGDSALKGGKYDIGVDELR